MPLTLVVLAAGVGSRYGDRLKQIDGVGPSGEALMDYSLFDAVRAGFDRIVFVIRRDIETIFRARVGLGLGRRIATDFAYQELTALPAGFAPPAGRVKPWGTAHALLCCRNLVREPFAVINADDFYGRASYAVAAGFLRCADPGAPRYALVGFPLRRTLSPHGPVARAVCVTDGRGRLTGIVERTRIEARADGAVVSMSADGASAVLPADTVVSMNLWGFTPALFAPLAEAFESFLARSGQDLKAEFYLPDAVGGWIEVGRASVQVLRTEAEWFGITYPPDHAAVVAAIRTLVGRGDYPADVRF